MNIVPLHDVPTLDAFQLACRLPRERMFRRYVAFIDSRLETDEVSEKHATNYLHNRLNIASRTEIKGSPEAARRLEYLRRDYMRWFERQEQEA